MRTLGLAVLALLLTLSAQMVVARERQIFVIIPLPQGKLVPPWTDSVRVSLVDDEDTVIDHRHFKKGTKMFRAVLSGAIHNREYKVEILCLGKQGKPIAVFQQSVSIKPATKKLELKALKYLEIQQ